MGRLIPVFEEKPGRPGKLFEGKFRDDETGVEGFLKIPHNSGSAGMTATPVFQAVRAAEQKD